MEKQTIISGFQQVDSSEYEYLIQFLENVAAYPIVKESLELQIKLLNLKPGEHVLDVGCGIGIQALEMAKQVNPTGKVTGTDISSVMIEFAKSKASDSDLPLDFFVAEADTQPFPDQTFDAVRTERVLMYIKDTQKVLKEFKRLLKPGGRLVIFDLHWDGTLLSHKDKALTRRIIHYVTDHLPNGNVGTDIYFHLKNNGFKNVEVKPYAYFGNDEILLKIVEKAYIGILQKGISDGVFTETEINNWWKSLYEDVEAGTFYISFPGLIGYGTND
ncbi:methyltransferase domain-containing protein [Chryseobacterium sp. JUb7]|uniref:methyltransferase domain-containing protein n=1 Tax=Chryseobacterium sp. JUb7 TaxID=2940599 RepID=UPI00216A5F6A|nr:methyltransferase domain-containing protein [Chryseobacterium sp. JUb7]MCS3529465.1 ubiquinone/menaquinone biosynthesis C-methylase UbiE [Chryseobacterium sp. JUb7]